MNYYMNSLNNSYLAVHTDALCANVAAIEKTLSPGAEIIPVLKCDAYGLSLSRCARSASKRTRSFSETLCRTPFPTP